MTVVEVVSRLTTMIPGFVTATDDAPRHGSTMVVFWRIFDGRT
jgi:hypothetical protein